MSIYRGNGGSSESSTDAFASDKSTTIITKNGSGVPSPENLVQGELAVDLTNGELYTKSGNSVIKIGSDFGGDINDISLEIDTINENITNIEGDISDIKVDVEGNKTEINNLRDDFDNHTHAIDDLSDVTSKNPDRDDLLIWNGTNWVADDFAFIQTALRFKGGIAPTESAPATPEAGDLYVFDADGTLNASWGALSGTAVVTGKFVGYAAGTNNRWYLLGNMADTGVMKVSPGIATIVDDSKPSEPVVSVDRDELDTWYVGKDDAVWVAEVDGDETRVSLKDIPESARKAFRFTYGPDGSVFQNISNMWVENTFQADKIFCAGENGELTATTIESDSVIAGVSATGVTVALEQTVLGGIAIGKTALDVPFTEQEQADAMAAQTAIQIIKPDPIFNKPEISLEIDKDGNITAEGVVQAKDYLDADGNSIIGNHDGDIANLQGQINTNAGNISTNAGDISALRNDFENHDHALDDLSDVSASNPTRDDLLIWNGSNWVSDDFSFIDTALQFKGGIAPTATAPTNPENGDLYVFDANGTIGSSWGVIAGTEVQVGKFVGWAATKNRWYTLGDMASIGVTDVVQGLGISVNDSKPSEPVVSVDRTETDKWYADKGHTHSQYLTDYTETDPTVPPHVKSISQADINKWNTSANSTAPVTSVNSKTGAVVLSATDVGAEPAFAKNNAFNKSFGTTNGTVAQGNHTHSQYLTSFTETDPTVPGHVKSISTTNISNWNAAHSWGNHGSQGYLKKETVSAGSGSTVSDIKIVVGKTGTDPNTLYFVV